jgi:hypothetical protein
MSSAVQLDATALAFLHNSNAIEDIHCIDYSPDGSGLLAGHATAFVHSQNLARARRQMSAIDLCYWQQLIVLEQRQANIDIPSDAVGRFRSGFVPYNVGVGNYVPPSFTRVPDLMQAWIRDLRTHLVDDAQQPAAELVADICGEMLQRFEAIHPFVDGNGRVGRLLVNYLLTYWQLPLVVFHLAERDAFFAAHRSRALMRQFMRGKIVRGGRP